MIDLTEKINFRLTRNPFDQYIKLITFVLPNICFKEIVCSLNWKTNLNDYS